MAAVGAISRSAALGILLAFGLFSGPAFALEFGDDASRWANDGECDDPRFSGVGMTETLRLDADILHDATDCRQAYEAGRLTPIEPETGAGAAGAPDQPVFSEEAASPLSEQSAAVDFGDDSSKWANDNECDDPRFTGAGMTTTTLLDSDIRHDATDCRKKFDAGEIALKSPGSEPAQPADPNLPKETEVIGPGTAAPTSLEESALLRLKKVYRDHELLRTCARIPGLAFETSAIDAGVQAVNRLVEDRGADHEAIRAIAIDENDPNHDTAMRALSSGSSASARDEQTRQARTLLCSMYENSLTDNIRWLSDHLASR